MECLITGAAGFIGGHFLEFSIKNNLFKKIKVVDNLTYASNSKFIYHLANLNHIEFIQGSICDYNLMLNISKSSDIIVNFAAESHVDNSILNPRSFIDTNIVGVGVLLDCVRKHDIGKFVQISTDEVYGSIESGFATEKSILNPASPYSASKASADLLTNSFHETFGINTLLTRTTNNYGPRQHGEKLIPKIIDRLIRGEKIPIYGNGRNVRNWIYVDDNCRAISQVITKGSSGNTYNISGNLELTNLELVTKISNLMGLRPNIEFVIDRPGHDLRYAVSDEEIRKIGFVPEIDIEKGLSMTIDWYKSAKNGI